MINKSTKTNMKSRTTDKKKNIFTGVAISIVLIATPFLFYFYKFAPSDSQEWNTIFGTFKSNGFNSMQAFTHALFTKITFLTLTVIWFLTSTNWWKYAILVPLTMFLFQLSGIINWELKYIDEYDFWYSLPFILPIVFFLIYLSYRISKNKDSYSEIDNNAQEEISKMFSDNL